MSAEQLDRAEQIAKRWNHRALSTVPIAPASAADAIDALFVEVGLAAPTGHRFYPSPAAAYADAMSWSSRVERILVFPWAWALPLCNPQFRSGARDECTDLAIRRRWNRRKQCTIDAPTPDTAGAVITRDALHQVWERVSAGAQDDPYPGLLSPMSDALYDELFEMSVQEDPSNPLAWWDYVLLGPMRWAVRECAMLEVAADVLGCRVRRQYRAAIAAMVEHCGLVLAFDPVALICDRPRAIRGHTDAVEMVFSDGTTVRAPRRDPALV